MVQYLEEGNRTDLYYERERYQKHASTPYVETKNNEPTHSHQAIHRRHNAFSPSTAIGKPSEIPAAEGYVHVNVDVLPTFGLGTVVLAWDIR